MKKRIMRDQELIIRINLYQHLRREIYNSLKSVLIKKQTLIFKVYIIEYRWENEMDTTHMGNM